MNPIIFSNAVTLANLSFGVLSTDEIPEEGDAISSSSCSNKTGNDGDIQAVGELNKRFNSNISSRIFLPKYRMYVPYNENSNINDFEQAKKEKLCREILKPVLESFYAPYSAF